MNPRSTPVRLLANSRDPFLGVLTPQVLRIAVSLVVTGFVCVEDVLAEGIRNPPPGTFGLARAGGRVTHVDDATAITHNPANLIELEEREFNFTPSVIYMEVDYESPSGVKAETENPWKILPNFFIASPVKQGSIAAGLGVTVPYGLSIDWAEKGAFLDPASLRYTAPNYSELVTINANPTLSFALSEAVSAGVGLDIMWSELSLQQYYPWFLFPGSGGTEKDGELKGKGDGFGWGGNAGITWRIDERHRVAATVRSAMDIEYEGETKINNITPVGGFLGATSRSDFETEIKFPTILSIGYGFQVTDKIRVGADLEWLEFSNFKSLDLDLGNNNLLVPDRELEQNWNDTFTVGFAGDWQVTERCVLRAGYQFYESPVPDRYFTPGIPDSNQHVITMGAGYRRQRHALEASYGLDFYTNRDIDSNQNSSFNGDYEWTVHLFSFAYRFLF